MKFATQKEDPLLLFTLATKEVICLIVPTLKLLKFGWRFIDQRRAFMNQLLVSYKFHYPELEIDIISRPRGSAFI